MMTPPHHHSAGSVELKLLPVIRKSEVKSKESKGGKVADTGEVVVYSGKEQPRPRGEICVRWKGTRLLLLEYNACQGCSVLISSKICNIRRNTKVSRHV